MSERKRLTDAAVRAGWQGLNMAGAVPKGLRADHLQAREDVKRLRERILLRMEEHCQDDDRCQRCAADAALLVETGT